MQQEPLRQEICSRVARLLREERQRQNLSLNALAERSGLSRQTISFIEQEERNPTLETMLRIAGALKLQLSAILQKAEQGIPQKR